MAEIINLDNNRIDTMIRTGLWEQMQADLEDNARKNKSIEEHINEIHDLIGYKRPPEFKLLKED